MERFKVGNVVLLVACPFDIQIPGERERYEELKDRLQVITAIRSCADHSTSQWIKTNLMDDWVDATWFKLKEWFAILNRKCVDTPCKRKVEVYAWNNFWCRLHYDCAVKLRGDDGGRSK